MSVAFYARRCYRRNASIIRPSTRGQWLQQTAAAAAVVFRARDRVVSLRFALVSSSAVPHGGTTDFSSPFADDDVVYLFAGTQQLFRQRLRHYHRVAPRTGSAILASHRVLIVRHRPGRRSDTDHGGHDRRRTYRVLIDRRRR